MDGNALNINVGGPSAGGRLATYEHLPCGACGSQTFVPLVTIMGKPASGTTTKQVGWQCSQCQTVANISAMQSAQVRAQRKQELAALIAQDEQEMAPTPSVPTSASSGSKLSI